MSLGLRSLIRRTTTDFSRRSYLDDYRHFLEAAVDRGFKCLPLTAWVEALRVGTAPERVLAIRHDVDISDVAGNTELSNIESAVGARSTFFFRLSTVSAHRRLIDTMNGEGFDVGYHFEELSSHAKRHGPASLLSVANGQRIRDEFRENCNWFRECVNPGLTAIASHGDWMNRRLDVTNNAFIDRELLDDCGLLFEAYDRELTEAADLYLTDTHNPPATWATEDSWLDNLDAYTCIYCLVHERHWSGNVFPRLRANGERLRDAVLDTVRRHQDPPPTGAEIMTAFSHEQT